MVQKILLLHYHCTKYKCLVRWCFEVHNTLSSQLCWMPLDKVSYLDVGTSGSSIQSLSTSVEERMLSGSTQSSLQERQAHLILQESRNRLIPCPIVAGLFMSRECWCFPSINHGKLDLCCSVHISHKGHEQCFAVSLHKQV